VTYKGTGVGSGELAFGYFTRSGLLFLGVGQDEDERKKLRKEPGLTDRELRLVLLGTKFRKDLNSFGFLLFSRATKTKLARQGLYRRN